MKEKLIQLWERKERYMEEYPTREVRAAFFHQAFGALEMAMTISDNWEKEEPGTQLLNEDLSDLQVCKGFSLY